MWPNMWDVTVGVHVDSNEFGRQALIREAKEELGIDIQDDEIKYLISSTSINKKKNIIDKHYNECYLITKEISEVKYFTKKEILERINNNYEGLTEKTGPWNFLKRILNNYML